MQGATDKARQMGSEARASRANVKQQAASAAAARRRKEPAGARAGGRPTPCRPAAASAQSGWLAVANSTHQAGEGVRAGGDER
jgi:hypothetical protein